MFDYQDETRSFRMRTIDLPPGDNSEIERLRWTESQEIESLWSIETKDEARSLFIQHGLNKDKPEIFDSNDCNHLLLMIGGMGYVISKCSGSGVCLEANEGYVYIERPLVVEEGLLVLADSRRVLSVDLHTGSIVTVVDFVQSSINDISGQNDELVVSTSNGEIRKIHFNIIKKSHRTPAFLEQVESEIGFVPSLHDAYLIGFALDGPSNTLYLKFMYTDALGEIEEERYFDSIVRIMIILPNGAKV